MECFHLLLCVDDVMFMKSLSDGLAMPRGNGSGPHVLLRDDAS